MLLTYFKIVQFWLLLNYVVCICFYKSFNLRFASYCWLNEYDEDDDDDDNDDDAYLRFLRYALTAFPKKIHLALVLGKCADSVLGEKRDESANTTSATTRKPLRF